MPVYQNNESLNEGYFHVPQKVFQSLINAYYKAYEKFRVEGIKRVTEKNFPSERFYIDFSDSRYEFLNKLNPKPSIVLSFTAQKDNSFFDPSGIQNTNECAVTIDLQQNKRAVYDVIEHEMLHFVQELVRNYKRKLLHKKLRIAQDARDWKEASRISKAIAKMEMGGLPSEKYIASGVSTVGYKVGGKKTRRVQHSKRPIEYYPDLLSAIRALHNDYYQESSSDEGWEIRKNSELLKKKFFVKFMNDVNNDDKKGLARYIFSKFKEMDPEFYKKMLAIAYDAFVNKDANFDPVDIKKKFDAISQKAAARGFVGNPVKDSGFMDTLLYYFRAQNNESIYIDLEDPSSKDSVFDLLRDIGIKVGSSENTIFPGKDDEIKELFNRLYDKKKSGRMYGIKLSRFERLVGLQNINSEELTPEIINKFYEHIFTYIRRVYIKNIADSSRIIEFTKFINTSFGLSPHGVDG